MTFLAVTKILRWCRWAFSHLEDAIQRYRIIVIVFSTWCQQHKLEYLAVYGSASMGVPVGELQSTMAPTTDHCLSHLYSDWASDTFFCHGQKRDYLSRASQRARGATKKRATSHWGDIPSVVTCLADCELKSFASIVHNVCVAGCLNRSHCWNPLVVSKTYDNNASVMVTFTNPPANFQYEAYNVHLKQNTNKITRYSTKVILQVSS